MSYIAKPLRLDEHRDALAGLWSENMSDPRIASAIPRRMRWLYEQGPQGPAVTVLAVHVESSEVVGCASLFRRAVWVDGRRTPTGVLCEFAVARAHRTAGAALTIQRALVEAGRAAGLELLYGFPNDRSIAVLERIGYRVVGEATRWAKPLGAAYKVRQILPWRCAARLCTAPIDAGLRALDGLRAVSWPRLNGKLVANPVGQADSLWERARPSSGVVGERCSAYLDWRYLRYPTAEHRMFGVALGGEDRLGGYAIYTVEDGTAVVRDLFAAPVEGLVEALLLALAAHLRAQQVDSLSLSYIGAATFGERLRRLGFLPRPGRRSLVLHPEGIEEARRARMFDPSAWFMLDGELDL